MGAEGISRAGFQPGGAIIVINHGLWLYSGEVEG
jgi:hypothetical protein